MIKCEPYRAEFLTEATCLSNQIKIANAKKLKTSSRYLMLFHPDEVIPIMACIKCEEGKRIYREWKAHRKKHGK